MVIIFVIFRRADPQQSAQERENEPGENTLDEPETLPIPFFDLVDRNIAAGLAECPECDD